MNDFFPSYIPRVYGRRQAQPLKSRQAELMANLLPALSIRVPEQGPSQARLDLQGLFPGKDEIWLEVGFGGGEHLVWQAMHNPGVGMIGAEPFINGVAKLLVHLDDEKPENVRVHHGDARPLIEALPDQSLSRIFVLHPDPWPKVRHYKRRIINDWLLEQAVRLLRPGSLLRVASDIDDYIVWTLMHVQRQSGLRWTATGPRDWLVRRKDWPQTRYEAKAIREGRVPTYLEFERR